MDSGHVRLQRQGIEPGPARLVILLDAEPGKEAEVGMVAGEEVHPVSRDGLPASRLTGLDYHALRLDRLDRRPEPR